MRGEEEKISVDGNDYMIDENFADEQIPQGFSRVKLSYKEREYEGLVNPTETLRLICLKNDAESKFFVYNQEEQTFSELIMIQRGEGKYIIPLSLEGRADKYQNAEIINVQLQDKHFEAWKLDDEFSIVYALNQDGNELLYRYDSVEEVFQRYTDTELDLELETEPTEKEFTLPWPDEYYLYVVGVLAGLCLILLVAMIYFIASRKQRHEARKKKMQRKLEKQRAKEERIAEKIRRQEEKMNR